MSLLQQINECSEEEIDSIIKCAIDDANKNATSIDTLGYISLAERYFLFKGFIPLNARIKYCNYSTVTYGMQTTDFFYEFAHFIRKNKINSIGLLACYLEQFMNDYFGYPNGGSREDFFETKAAQTTTTDKEYFEALEKYQIGDLKGIGVAKCTERAALAQQILSLFGLESYYCIGCVRRDGKEIPHAFNVLKRAHDYALLDYSITATTYNADGTVRYFEPFLGKISLDELTGFIDGNIVKTFLEYKRVDNETIFKNIKREYVIGRNTIEKNDEMGFEKI